MLKRFTAALAALMALVGVACAEEDAVNSGININDWVYACTETVNCPTHWYTPPYAEGDEGKLRFICETAHLAYDDPIVFPNQPGIAHLHHFFGNTATNAFSTYQSLRLTGSGSCEGGPLNRTGYWFPAMIHRPTNKVVRPYFIEMYYNVGRRGFLKDFTSPVCPGGNLQDGRAAACPQQAVIKMERGLKFVMGFKPGAGKFPDTYGGYPNFPGPGGGGAQNFQWQCVSSFAGQKSVTGAANNGAGKIRLTLNNTTGLLSGALVLVGSVNGTTEANGTWAQDVIDGTHIDLRGSAFSNAFTSSPGSFVVGGSIGGKPYFYDPDTPSNGFTDTTCPANNGIWVRLEGPTCWNGSYDSTDHYSHMAFGYQDGNGNYLCPATHPKTTSVLTVIVGWPNDQGEADFKDWKLSSDFFGAATYKGGQSFHTDWFGAWEDSVQFTWHSELNGMYPTPGSPPYLDTNLTCTSGNCPWGGSHVKTSTNGGLGNGTAMISGNLGNGFVVSPAYEVPARLDVPSPMTVHLIYRK